MDVTVVCDSDAALLEVDLRHKRFSLEHPTVLLLVPRTSAPDIIPSEPPERTGGGGGGGVTTTEGDNKA